MEKRFSWQSYFGLQKINILNSLLVFRVFIDLMMADLMHSYFPVLQPRKKAIPLATSSMRRDTATFGQLNKKSVQKAVTGLIKKLSVAVHRSQNHIKLVNRFHVLQVTDREPGNLENNTNAKV